MTLYAITITDWVDMPEAQTFPTIFTTKEAAIKRTLELCQEEINDYDEDFLMLEHNPEQDEYNDKSYYKVVYKEDDPFNSNGDLYMTYLIQPVTLDQNN